MDKMTRPVWQLLLLTSESKKPIDLTCEECISLLEFDAYMMAMGAVYDEIHSFASHHLTLCSDCQTKVNDWLDKLARAEEK